jgi:hypothetical protein
MVFQQALLGFTSSGLGVTSARRQGGHGDLSRYFHICVGHRGDSPCLALVTPGCGTANAVQNLGERTSLGIRGEEAFWVMTN